jgi:succinoglycan biosynthesis transport protein ExoP
MELRQYVSMLLRWWWLVVVSVLVASVAAYVATKATPYTYVSRTTIMVGQVLSNPNANQSDLYTGEALAQSYSDLVGREPTLKAALQAVGLPWDWTVLQGMVQSRVVPGTQLLEIAVTDTDPQRAKVLADTVAQQLISQSPSANDPEKEAERQFILSQIDDLKTNIKNAQDELLKLDDIASKATSARQIQDARDQQATLQAQITTWQSTYAQLLSNLQKGTPNYLSVMEPAQLSTTPVGPKVAQNVMLAAVIGLALSVCGIFLMEYIDDTVHSADDVRKDLQLPVMGSIADIKGADYGSKLMPIKQPRSPVAEAYRMLRTNLQFSDIDHPRRVLLMTSCGPLEGKSVTSANLSIVMAQSGKRVILVDVDLHRPMQHKIFDLDNSRGLTTLLLHPNMPLPEVIHTTTIPNLRVLTAGQVPADPSILLNSKRMTDVIAALRQEADIVIFDTPPTLVVSDASALATRADGVLLVIQAGRTRRAAAKQAKDGLLAVGANIIGVVLNRLEVRNPSYYTYYTPTEEGKTQHPVSRWVKSLRSRVSHHPAGRLFQPTKYRQHWRRSHTDVHVIPADEVNTPNAEAH